NFNWDMAEPAVWGTVGALDPLMFSSVDEYIDGVLAGAVDGRYTPLEVAGWIDGFTERGAAALADFRAAARDDPQTRRTLIDLEVLVRLGRFLATQYRAATSYANFDRTGSADAITEAVALVENSRAHWAELVGLVDGVYQDDLASGLRPSEHTQWKHQLPEIDEDLRTLRRERDRATRSVAGPQIALRTERPWRLDGVSHEQPAPYDRGATIPLRVDVDADTAIASAVLYYRHLDQSQAHRSVQMRPVDGGFVAEIPGDYSDSSFSLGYFFVVTPADADPMIVPGFTDDTLSQQPYYTLRSTGAS